MLVKHNYILLSCLSFCFSLLVVNGYPPWQGFYNESIAFIACVLLLIPTLFKIKTFSLTPLCIVLIAIFLIFVCQFFTIERIFFGDFFLYSFFLFISFCFLFVRFELFDVKNTFLNFFIFILVFIGLVNAFLACCQYFQLSYLGIWLLDAEYGGRTFGNVGQSNLFASLLSLSLLAIVFFVLQKKVGSFTFFLYAITILLAMVTTNSKIAYVEFLAIALWLIFFTLLTANKKQVFKVLGILLSAALTVYFIDYYINDLLFSRNSPDLRIRTAINRLVVWLQLFGNASELPWYGAGLMQVPYVQFLTENISGDSVLRSYSHNIFLDLIIFMGWLSAPVILFSIYWFFKKIFKIKTLEQWFCLGVIIILGLHAQVEYPLYYLFMLFPFLIAVSFLEKDSKIIFTIKASYLGVCVVFMLLVSALLIAYDYIRLENYHRLQREAIMFNAPIAQDLPKVMVLDQLQSYIYLKGLESDSVLSDEQLKDLYKTVRRYPYSSSWEKYFQLLIANKNFEQATIILSKIREFFPDRYNQILLNLQFLKDNKNNVQFLDYYKSNKPHR